MTTTQVRERYYVGVMNLPRMANGQTVRGFVGRQDVLSDLHREFKYRPGLTLENIGRVLCPKGVNIKPSDLKKIGFGVETAKPIDLMEGIGNPKHTKITGKMKLRDVKTITSVNLAQSSLWRVGKESEVLNDFDIYSALDLNKDNPEGFGLLAMDYLRNDPDGICVVDGLTGDLRIREINAAEDFVMSRAIRGLKEPIAFEYTHRDDVFYWYAQQFLSEMVGKNHDDPANQSAFMSKVLDYSLLSDKEDIERICRINEGNKSDIKLKLMMKAAEYLHQEDIESRVIFLNTWKPPASPISHNLTASERFNLYSE